jgi:hypothetical protein
MMRLYCSKWTDCLDKMNFAVRSPDPDSYPGSYAFTTPRVNNPSSRSRQNRSKHNPRICPSIEPSELGKAI